LIETDSTWKRRQPEVVFRLKNNLSVWQALVQFVIVLVKKQQQPPSRMTTDKIKVAVRVRPFNRRGKMDF
jgi:hypothetical protein